MIQRNEMATLPPVFAASALYDNLLQAALRQFFSRATFETEPIPSLSSDGRLAIEPTNDPDTEAPRDPTIRAVSCSLGGCEKERGAPRSVVAWAQ